MTTNPYITVAHRLPRRQFQRAIDDVLLRITFRDGTPSRVEYTSKGRAEYALARYSRQRFIVKTDQPFWVERVQTERVA